MNRHRIDATFHLLDRQIVDPDGAMAGKVDDLELTPPAGDPAGAPHVTAIIGGPGPLAHRIDRRLASWFRREWRIDFGAVDEVGVDVRVSTPVSELPVGRAEAAVWEKVVLHLPGGRRHAGE
jgi:sporulation protein YlmC with PRC-barrel domain